LDDLFRDLLGLRDIDRLRADRRADRRDRARALSVDLDRLGRLGSEFGDLLLHASDPWDVESRLAHAAASKDDRSQLSTNADRESPSREAAESISPTRATVRYSATVRFGCEAGDGSI